VSGQFRALGKRSAAGETLVVLEIEVQFRQFGVFRHFGNSSVDGGTRDGHGCLGFRCGPNLVLHLEPTARMGLQRAEAQVAGPNREGCGENEQ
jgi:hypothetical protein